MRESRPGKLCLLWLLGTIFSKYPLLVSLFLCPPCILKQSVVRGIVQCEAFTLRPWHVFLPWISSFGGAILVLLVLAWVFCCATTENFNMRLSIDFTGPRALAWYPDPLVCVGALKPWGLAKTHSTCRGAHKSINHLAMLMKYIWCSIIQEETVPGSRHQASSFWFNQGMLFFYQSSLSKVHTIELMHCPHVAWYQRVLHQWFHQMKALDQPVAKLDSPKRSNTSFVMSLSRTPP